MLRKPGKAWLAMRCAGAARPGKILREAFFTNLFNPKVALFSSPSCRSSSNRVPPPCLLSFWG
jgi:hypothetical protein